jgi:hypothetical protein
MALTPNIIPSQVPLPIAPFDINLAFTQDQVMVATGYLNNVTQAAGAGTLDLGSTAPGTGGAGRKEGYWVLDIKAVDMVGVDESYKVGLVGSNNVAFTAGDVELLAFHDFAASAALRVFPAILGVTPAIPPTGIAGTMIHMPFSNLMQRIVYRYLRCYALHVGATSSITVTSWVSFGDNKH